MLNRTILLFFAMTFLVAASPSSAKTTYALATYALPTYQYRYLWPEEGSECTAQDDAEAKISEVCKALLPSVNLVILVQKNEADDGTISEKALKVSDCRLLLRTTGY